MNDLWLRISHSLVVLMLTVGCVVLVCGCPEEETDDDDDDTSGPSWTIDIDADTDCSGSCDASDEEDAAEGSYPGTVSRTDVDDDNVDGTLDNEVVDIHAEENDLDVVVIQPDSLADLPDDAWIELTLEGDVNMVLLYMDGEPILGTLGDTTIASKTLTGVAGTAPLFEVRALDFHGMVTLRAELYDGDDELRDADELVLHTAPFMMYNHLDEAHTLYVLTDSSNQFMRDGIRDAIGAENMVEVPAMQYGWDVWMQDEIEFGYQQTPYGPMDLVLDSIRGDGWGGLDNLPEDLLVGPDFGMLVRGSGYAQSVDSFGNLECSPPVTVDGVEYPFGRIYYGGKMGNRQVTSGLREFLAAQEVQAPVEIDSTWLAVGHVDEFMLFLPDPDSDKGFKLGYTDTRIAMDILESVDPNMAIPRFDDHGFTTVREILQSGIPDYNEDLQVQYMDPILEIVKETFGLDDSDVVMIPGIWEQTSWGGLAMVPGITNMAVWNHEMLIADPFFRTPDEDVDGDGSLDYGEDLNGNGELDTDEDANGNGVLDDGEDTNNNGALDTEEDANANWLLDDGEDLNGDGQLNTYRDPFIEAFNEVAPAALNLHYLDNWNTYHLMWGEVHCGTNIIRTPREDLMWWEVE
jgi:hypothetical protein